MNLRQANQGDNEALLALTKKTPMVGTLSAYVDRSPDFFRFPKSQGDSSEMWVAEEEGKVCALISIIYRNTVQNGKKVRLAYTCDMKVDPDTQNKRVAKTLYNKFVEIGLGGPSEIGEAEIIDNNTRALRLMKSLRKKKCNWRESGQANLYQIFPYRKYKENKNFEVRCAIESDIPVVAKLLTEQYKNYHSTPDFSEEGFREILNRDESFSIKNFRVASKNNQVVACSAFWMHNEIRRTVIVNINPMVKLLFSGLNLLRAPLRLPKMPKINEALKINYIRFMAAKDSDYEAVRAILHKESNDLRKKKACHLMLVGFHELDKMAQVISKFWKMSMKINLFHFEFSKNSSFPQEVSEPNYVDFSLI